MCYHRKYAKYHATYVYLYNVTITIREQIKRGYTQVMNENTQQLFDDIYSIKVPLPGNPLKNVNNYYIKGRERNLLIDTAFNMPECLEALKSGLDGINADMDRTDIFLTHLHSDHTGLAAEIAGSGTRVYIGETDRERLELFLKEEYWDTVYKRNLMLGFSEEEIEKIKANNPASKYLPSKPVKYIGIEDGHTFDLGGYKLRCISTPGHTPGNMCIYEEGRKILFSGDHIIFDISPNITAWADVDDSLGMYIDSMEKICRLDVSVTFSGHRSIVGDVYSRAGELVRHHETRLEEVLQIVNGSDGITTYDVAAGMTWSIRASNWSDFPVTQKWFAVGEASAHLDYQLKRDRIKMEIRDGKYFYKSRS